MKLPRFTIGGVMLLVLLFAANFACIRIILPLYEPFTGRDFAAVVLPMANILILAAATMWRSAVGRGEISPSLFRFTVVGLLTCVLLAFGMVSFDEELGSYFQWTFGWAIPTIRSWMNSGSTARSVAGHVLGYGFMALDFTLPQILIASSVAWLLRKRELPFLRRKRRAHESIPPPDEARR